MLLLRKGLWRTKKRNNTNVTNELIHPRFEMATNDVTALKTVPNSLLFLMYSKENDVLFI
ncbi:hypothetical protein DNC80_04425 [Flavobacterium sp. SOK18b]|nr:hypothetical protein [Flavobacterium sp. SOK18b]